MANFLEILRVFVSKKCVLQIARNQRFFSFFCRSVKIFCNVSSTCIFKVGRKLNVETKILGNHKIQSTGLQPIYLFQKTKFLKKMLKFWLGYICF